MRISVKILLVMLFVALVPVFTSGVTSVVLARRAVTVAVEDKLSAEARHFVELAESTIVSSLDDLRQASTLSLASLSKDEIAGALWVIYRGDAARTAVALIDGDTGESVVAPVFQSSITKGSLLDEHEVFLAEHLQQFANHVPLADAVASSKAVSVPYADKARGTPLIALAVRVPGPKKADGTESKWVIAVELSLRRLNERFAEAKDEDFSAALIDLDGKVVCHTDAAIALAREDLSNNKAVSVMRDVKASASGAIDDDKEVIAYARSSQLASNDGKTWGVVVTRDKAEALGTVEALSKRTGFWIVTALVLALLSGLILARGIARPIERLTSIVKRFSANEKGAKELRAPDLGTDEIGVLAQTFNTMADDIESYTAELRGFNTQLQVKVDERTRELKETQNQLIQSQKMAAVGELGAGVAHEINNPLAGVLGSAQLALLRTDKTDTRIRPHLEDIEREALRIKDIVENLLKLSHDEHNARAPLDVNLVVESAVSLLARPIIAQRISVKKELAENLPKIKGNASDLQQVIIQLLHNAKDAMPDGGTLTVRTENVDSKLVRISVDDSGPGIPAAQRERVFEPFFTTRASKGHKGMGLAVVHRVVEEHGGRVTIEDTAQKGASIRIVFPSVRDGMHLI